MSALVSFEYVKVASIEDLYRLKRTWGEDAAILAGGTDLVPLLKRGELKARALIDIAGLVELKDIGVDDDGIRIGAGVTLQQILDSRELKSIMHALWQAVKVMACPAIRTVATLCGNVCNASPVADSVGPLLVFGAEVEIGSVSGKRREPLDRFIVGPGRTTLGPHEVVLGIWIPRMNLLSRSSYYRIAKRGGFTLTVVGAAVAVEYDSVKGRIDDIRVALTGAAPKPMRLVELEQTLKRRCIGEITAEWVRRSVDQHVQVREKGEFHRADPQYRKMVAPVAVLRALRQALDGGQGNACQL